MKQTLCAALTVGLLVTGVLPAFAQDTATVYVYRQKKFGGSGLEPAVYVDDKKVAEMDNGRYFAIKVPAGEHVIRSNEKDSVVDQEWKAGQVYFLRISIAAGMMKGHGEISPISEKQARKEMEKLKPLGEEKVDKANGSMVVLDPIK